MKKMIAALAACAMAVPAIVSAGAMEDAVAANICDVTAAEYLADGRLKVTCRPGTVNPAYAGAVTGTAGAGGTGLVGGTLSAGAAAGIAAGVIIIAVAASEDDTTTTTTTTGSGS